MLVEFINQMSIAGMAEVQIGMLASERGTNADVKAFGQMMVKDHSQANKELAQVAAQLKLPPPKELDASRPMRRLSGLGQARARDSKRAHSVGQDLRPPAPQAGRRANRHDPVGEQTLPVVQQHLERAQSIRAMLK